MVNKKHVSKLVFMLFFVFLIKSLFAETDKSKLRWEYKYGERTILRYRQNAKVTYTKKDLEQIKTEVPETFKLNETETAEGVETFVFEKSKEDTKVWNVSTGLWEKEKWDQTKRFLKLLEREDHQRGGKSLIVRNDGSADDIWVLQNSFLIAQPRFVESGLDVWSKKVDLYDVIGHYRKLGEEVLNGRKCVIIETEIGQTENGTNDEMGYIIRGANQKPEPGDVRIKLKGKTWFDYENGIIAKMEFSKQIAAFTFKKEWFYKPEIEFSFELLNDAEIKKLDGIEDAWELVLTNANFLQVTAEEKLLFIRGEKVKEEGDDGKEKEIEKTFIWIAEADGSNQRKLAEGTNFEPSLDGKLIAFDKIWKDAKYGQMSEAHLINSDGTNERVLARDENISYSAKDWSPNGEWLVLLMTELSLEGTKVKGENKTGIISVDGKKVIIDENGHPYGHTSWSAKNDLLSFTKLITGDAEINFIYNLKTQKLEEFKELNNRKASHNGVWSPKDLIFAYGIVESPLSLLSFSDNYEVANEKVLLRAEDKEYISPIFSKNTVKWTKDGKYLVYRSWEYEKNYKLHVYGVNEGTDVYKDDFNYDYFIISPDLKWRYFYFTGAITSFGGWYRTPAPKEMQDIFQGGKR